MAAFYIMIGCPPKCRESCNTPSNPISKQSTKYHLAKSVSKCKEVTHLHL